MNTPIPIDALFDDHCDVNESKDYRPVLNAADIILGVDVMSEREFLVFGRQALEQIAVSGQTDQLVVVKIALDQDSTELEKLIALVTVIKGSHDYL